MMLTLYVVFGTLILDGDAAAQLVRVGLELELEFRIRVDVPGLA